MGNSKIDDLVARVSMVFKSYDHKVILSKNKSTLWHFTSTYQGKKYNIYCTLNMAKVKSLIKIALKKTPTGTRLVVICAEFDQEQKASAEAHGHTLIDLSTLKKYGVDIIEAKAKEAMKAS